MQVSWIDPDELARLASELNGPLPSAEPAVSWDLNTIPELTADALMPQSIGAPAVAPVSPAPEVQEPGSAAGHPALDHIREKLRAIRSRAQEAGILPKHQTPAPAELPTAPPPPPPAPAQVAAPNLVASSPPPAADSQSPAPAAPAEIPPSALPNPPTNSRAFLNLDGTLTERLASFMTWAERYAPSREILLVDDHGELLWGNPSHPELALSAILAANVSLREGVHTMTQQPAASLKLADDKNLTVLPCVTRLGLVTLALLNPESSPTNEQISCLREALTLSVEGRN
jgi:hypothetical protein